MYMEAFPTHRKVPGPCVPRFSRALSFVQHPGTEFKNAMIRRLVQRERSGVEEANQQLKTFLKRLPIFYEVLSQPEVWGREKPLGSDESDDEVDEPSTAQPVEIVEPRADEKTDISTQQDDGTTDERSDTQAEQETPPSSPTTS